MSLATFAPMALREQIKTVGGRADSEIEGVGKSEGEIRRGEGT